MDHVHSYWNKAGFGKLIIGMACIIAAHKQYNFDLSKLPMEVI